jgi:hypothetical protein
LRPPSHGAAGDRAFHPVEIHERLDDSFRLWFTEHAIHGDSADQADRTDTVSYLGVLYQALRDVSAWVEKGVAPPASTNYKVVDGQVQVPPGPPERRGIQPVIRLTANGTARADVKLGQAVSAEIETPPGGGQIVAAQWDFETEGAFPQAVTIKSSTRSRVAVTAKHAFSKAGTYFVVLRATSQRDGNVNTPFARIQNLTRVRVVVSR